MSILINKSSKLISSNIGLNTVKVSINILGRMKPRKVFVTNRRVSNVVA